MILILFQYSLFAFLPAVNPDLSASQQKNEAIDFILKKDMLLLIETFIGLSILFLINRKALKIPLKTALIISFVEFGILIVIGLLFSLNYINKYSSS